MNSIKVSNIFCFFFLSSCASMPTLPNKEFKVVITSIPEGAEVQLNGYYVGKTPYNLTFSTNSGNFIFVKKDGFSGQRIPLDRKQKEISVQLIKEEG